MSRQRVLVCRWDLSGERAKLVVVGSLRVVLPDPPVGRWHVLVPYPHAGPISLVPAVDERITEPPVFAVEFRCRPLPWTNSAKDDEYVLVTSADDEDLELLFSWVGMKQMSARG